MKRLRACLFRDRSRTTSTMRRATRNIQVTCNRGVTERLQEKGVNLKQLERQEEVEEEEKEREEEEVDDREDILAVREAIVQMETEMSATGKSS